MTIDGEVATPQIISEEDQDVGTGMGREEGEGKGQEEETTRIHRLCCQIVRAQSLVHSRWCTVVGAQSLVTVARIYELTIAGAGLSR